MLIVFASLIILAPLYVWRFSIPVGGGLPTNFLMLANFLVIGVGFLMMLRDDVASVGASVGASSTSFKMKSFSQRWCKVFAELGRPMLIAIGLFGLASIISLFVFGINGEKLAQWVVLYFQPLIIFLIIRYFLPSVETDSVARDRWIGYFYKAAYIIVAAAGTLAVVQYFTLQTLPPAWWGNANEPKRAIAFFAHANAFGLFVTPLLAWLIPDVVEKLNKFLSEVRFSFSFESVKRRFRPALWPVLGVLLWAVGVVGMFLSLSRGAWLGLFVAVAVYAIICANKKVILSLIVTGVILTGVVMVVPNLRYRVLLPFQGEKSTVARFSLWDTAGKMIKDNPILGKGVNGFSDNWETYNTDPGLEHYNFPHNILLNFWVDLGLLGVVSMMTIFLVSAWRGLIRWREGRTNTAALGVILFLVAIVAHGLIDIPYLKNDLALVFWIILALGL